MWSMHVCSITLGRKQSRSWFYKTTNTICLYSSCPVEMLCKQRKQAAGSFLKDCWMWSSILTQFYITQYSLKCNFKITLDNLSPAQMTLSLGDSICMERALIFPAPEAAINNDLFFYKSTCQIQFFLLWCPEKQNNIHSRVPHMFSR